MKANATRALAATLFFALGGGAGCSEAGTSATVQLEIDGNRLDYATGRAEYDQQIEGGPYSVYLLRDEADEGLPYLGIRTFSGNPVARLWLRYRRPGDSSEGDELGRYECFVPGTLSDGTPTLGWRTADGEARRRQYTGEATCDASVVRDGDSLRVTFDAVVSPRALGQGKNKAEADEVAAEADRVRIRGSARVSLAPEG